MSSSELYVTPALVCAHGQFSAGERCESKPTHVLFFDRGDASTYCDAHGPKLDGPAHLRVVGRAELREGEAK